MAKFLVQKSAPLSGEVKISGSKNAVLPIMAATLLTDEPCVIKDVPALRDVEVMCRLLENLGATVNENLDDNRVDITASGEIRYEAPYDLVKMMRSVHTRAGRAAAQDRQGSDTSSGRMCNRQKAC